MISILLATVVGLTGVQNRPQSAFNRIFPHPTGKNGYEEYVRAGDMIRTSNQYFQWETYVLARDSGQDAGETPELPPGVTPEMSLLDVQREHVKRFGSVIDLIERGNAKEVYEPRETIDFVSVFPEFSQLKTIAKFAGLDIRVCFAGGQPDRAVAIADAILMMRAKMPSSTLISELVAIAIDAITFAAINDNAERISEQGWARLAAASDRRLASNPLLAALEGELRMYLSVTSIIRSLDSNIEGLFGADEDNSTSHVRAIAAYKALSPGQRDRLATIVEAKMRVHFKLLIEKLSGPESTWAEFEDDPVPNFDGSLDSLAAVLTGDLMPVFQGANVAEAKNRTQYRLLKLHAAVQRFKWHHYRLPKKLEEATKDINDPLTGESFIYEPNGLGGYKLASRGTKQTGEIQLRYVRVPGTQQGNDPPPP